VDIAGVDIDGRKRKGGQRRSESGWRKLQEWTSAEDPKNIDGGSKQQGWTLQEWTLTEESARVDKDGMAFYGFHMKRTRVEFHRCYVFRGGN